MKVKVHLKDGRAFEFTEQALLDDTESGRIALSYGKLNGGRIHDGQYHYEDTDHICYSWNDVEKLEVTP